MEFEHTCTSRYELYAHLIVLFLFSETHIMIPTLSDEGEYRLQQSFILGWWIMCGGIQLSAFVIDETVLDTNLIVNLITACLNSALVCLFMYSNCLVKNFGLLPSSIFFLPSRPYNLKKKYYFTIRKETLQKLSEIMLYTWRSIYLRLICVRSYAVPPPPPGGTRMSPPRSRVPAPYWSRARRKEACIELTSLKMLKEQRTNTSF